jgi:hypothetical protein
MAALAAFLLWYATWSSALGMQVQSASGTADFDGIVLRLVITSETRFPLVPEPSSLSLATLVMIGPFWRQSGRALVESA